MTTSKPLKIVPLVSRCKCGSKVLNHHFLCDKCYSIKTKRDNKLKKRGKFKKKGQAGMEFFMTYGWAIMAALIAIGVLAYFGVFDPDKYDHRGNLALPQYSEKYDSYCKEVYSSDYNYYYFNSTAFNCCYEITTETNGFKKELKCYGVIP